ncbi:hypothetical protein Saso_33180 [Streptomyces asoensis]|uniref:Secreted protein n=1 Tax=Streptomyces asoensis TaxID=249586 RepID=A0ABQ3S0L6_9ACTN|nr:hypothetical protein GCM10010496_26520 [Streptomyces asoensis]GHI61668.1 hypothetical protein Saso_33180 [Streptomyces asoensis]
MDRRGHTLKFTAVTVFVALALTGFSTSRGHGSRHSGGGGGCSSSGQDHDSSSSSGSTSGGSSGSTYHDYDDDDDVTGGTSGGGSSSTSTTRRDASVELITCATPGEAYATVEVTNPGPAGAYFTVTVDFLDAGSRTVERRSTDEYVGGNDTATVQVALSGPAAAAKADHCDPEPYAPAT